MERQCVLSEVRSEYIYCLTVRWPLRSGCARRDGQICTSVALSLLTTVGVT